MKEGKQIMVRKLFGYEIEKIISRENMVKKNICSELQMERTQLDDLLKGKRNQTIDTYLKVIDFFMNHLNNDNMGEILKVLKSK